MNTIDSIKYRAIAFPREFLVPSKIKQEWTKPGVELPQLTIAIQDGISLAARELWNKSQKLKNKRLFLGFLFYIGGAFPPFINLDLPYVFYRYLPFALMLIGVFYVHITEEIRKLEATHEILMTARRMYDESPAG